MGEEDLHAAVQAAELLLEHVDVAQQLVAAAGVRRAARGDRFLEDLQVEDHGVDRRPQVVGHGRRDLGHGAHLRGQAQVGRETGERAQILDEHHAAAPRIAAQVEAQAPRCRLGCVSNRSRARRGQVERGPGGAATGTVPAQPGALQAGLELGPQALELEAVLAAHELQGARIGEAHIGIGADEHDARAESADELVGKLAEGRSLGGFEGHDAGLHRSVRRCGGPQGLPERRVFIEGLPPQRKRAVKPGESCALQEHRSGG